MFLCGWLCVCSWAHSGCWLDLGGFRTKGPTPLLPVTLGYPHSLHLPCGPPMGDSLSYASLTTAVSSLTPAGQSSVLSCAHMIWSYRPISMSQEPQTVKGLSLNHVCKVTFVTLCNLTRPRGLGSEHLWGIFDLPATDGWIMSAESWRRAPWEKEGTK